jgi:hypothetical protein
MGRHVCLIDGDMQLHRGFLPAAIRFLEENPTVAGVGGTIIECETANLEFAQRTRRRDPDRQPGPVTRLDCSGVYRRSAIDSIGYLTDRNLHAGEELTLRLACTPAAGRWRGSAFPRSTITATPAAPFACYCVASRRGFLSAWGRLSERQSAVLISGSSFATTRSWSCVAWWSLGG